MSHLHFATQGKVKLNDAALREEMGRLLKSSSALTHSAVEAFADRLRAVDPKHPLLFYLNRLSQSALALDQVRRGIPHHVLNARYHELEAQIVAQTGRFGAVTIATNMAGRGTDILLGGNSDFLLKEELKTTQEIPPQLIEELKRKFQAQVEEEHRKVVQVGGLHVTGTERHEARRIDNQLRGRSGRQGDPGSSRFYVSLEDELVRIFGEGNRLLEWSKAAMPEGESIESGILSKAIENAQKRVELHNFEIRKRLLEYDNVMNRQREVIYKERREVLEGQDLKSRILEMVGESFEGLLALYAPEHQDPEEWNLKSLLEALEAQFGIAPSGLESLGRRELVERLEEEANKAYETRETLFGAETMRRLEQWVMLQVIDTKWKDHLYAMDHLREGIGYRAYGQQDPLVEYQHEAFQMFNQMIASVRTEVVELIFRIQPVRAERMARVLTPTQFLHPEAPTPMPSKTPSMLNPAMRYDAAMEPLTPGVEELGPPEIAHRGSSEPVRREQPKVGRNDPCPCGSGKKFKKCHGT